MKKFLGVSILVVLISLSCRVPNALSAGSQCPLTVATGELPGYLGLIGMVFTVRDEIDRCGYCGAFTTVFSLMCSL